MSRRVTGDISWLPLQDTVGQQREISAGNAKRGTFVVSPWGVAHNGSDGPAVRGLTRLSMWPERRACRSA